MAQPDRCCGGVDRRSFLQLAAAGAVGGLCGPGARRSRAVSDHFVPKDKQLTPEWLALLRARGEREVRRGAALRTVGMPCGGICSGQLYVRGDGTLAWWWIANDARNTGYGGAQSIDTELGTYPVCYAEGEQPPSPVDQGFAVRVAGREGQPAGVWELSARDFDDCGFVGEYPIAEIRYGTRQRPAPPVTVRAEVFSPFVPLDARASAHPCTILRYHVTNPGEEALEVSVAGWMQNPVGLALRHEWHADARNLVVRHGELASVRMDCAPRPGPDHPPGRVILFEDFEEGYGDWHREGEAFGEAPAAGTLEGQQPVSGHRGERLVNTFLGGDRSTGLLRSRPFRIELPFVVFLIGGGRHPGDTCIRLKVDGRVVRETTGRNEERLRRRWWDVGDLIGRTAELEIVDSARGRWGHVNVDAIELHEREPVGEAAWDATHPWLGDVALTPLDPDATLAAGYDGREELLAAFAASAALGGARRRRRRLGSPLLAAAASSAVVPGTGTHTFDFVLSWHFPGRQVGGGGTGAPVGLGDPVGNRYRHWFTDALDVARAVADRFDELAGATFAFRDALYDTTLPYWFVQRVSMPLSTLATETCHWRGDGRFWAWEGVGCCRGTCGHVWNYAQAHARLFPELERTVREQQDLGAALDPDTGAVAFRGRRGGPWAADAQAGVVLKAWRDHLLSADGTWLRGVWPRLRKVVGFLLAQDGDDDGLIEGAQHNTYDIEFHGPNTFVGSLYTAALAAAERMAALCGDAQLAAHAAAVRGRAAEATMQRLFDGEYFVQDVDLEEHPRHQYGPGCLADQMFGQAWAHQLGLGHVYPAGAVRRALQSVWDYNWAPDVGPQNEAHPPGRVFARPGEAGLFLCTWPKSPHLGGRGVRYRNEVWTGIEYQVAAHMLWEGMITEGLAIVRAIHERYDGTDHNPWNEVECGDHYARALASWGCLVAVSGFVYDGPAGRLGFDPRLGADDFRCVFTAAEGWGTLRQTRSGGRQESRVSVLGGRLRLEELALGVPPGGLAAPVARVTANDRELAGRARLQDHGFVFELAEPVVLGAGDAIVARLG